LLRELVAEIKGLRADLRKQYQPVGTAELLALIADYFGIGGRFSTGGLFTLAESREEFADALAKVIDMNASPKSRSTSLGAVLARLPGAQKVAERAGSAVYELKGTSP
jgi:hypothetical protein